MTAQTPTNWVPPTAADDFLSMARRLSLLDDEAVRKLETERITAGVPTAQLALRQGLLGPVQVDIIETLLHPDDVVPGFQFLDLIAQGGMGVVFRARQKSLNRTVALKTILVSQMHDQTSLARFEQEAQAVGRLRHPNIVTAYDLGRHQGRLYFVMELIEGEDVQRVIETQGPLEEAVVWRLLRQAAAGLSHAALAGIIHRDVKPANLLLVEPPAGFELPGGLKMVKITDFGLAFLTREVEVKTRLTSANAAIGSPHYLAPEQLTDDSFDHRVDIYSLGATAYHMLAGEPPFRAKSLSQIIAQKLAADSLDLLQDFPHVSPNSADLVRRMTQRDPGRRIASYAELIAEIDSLTPPDVKRNPPPRRSSVLQATQLIRSDPTPEQLAVPPIGLRGSRWRLANRRKFLALVGGGALVAGAAAVGVWSFVFPRSQKTSRRLVPTGLGLNVFDGRSLNGWQFRSGGWTVRRNAEGGRVLAGTDGVIRHTLVNQVGKTKSALAHFQLSVVIQLQGATAAGVEFGIDHSTGEDGARYVAQLSKEGVSAGQRETESRPYVRLTDARPLPLTAADPYTLIIERQPESWWILLNEVLIGSLPVRTRHEEPAFLLRADGGEAWFSDVTVQELAPPQAESHSAD
jgi:eukaryotic-like serine/threonine-protein kinase